MENSVSMTGITKGLKVDTTSGKSQPIHRLVAAIPKQYPLKAIKRIIDVDEHASGMESAVTVGLLLLKLGVLEAVRRFSKAHCPFIWHTLQALQVVCLPPFKRIRNCRIFRDLFRFMQALSKPMLLLSVGTSFCDRSTDKSGSSGSSDASLSRIDPPSDSPVNVASADLGEGIAQGQDPDNWISQLVSELDKEGVTLPERFTKDELRRFYDGANGDFSRFLTSIKKTISWRQNFRFMSEQELEDWSEMVFWHGRDVEGHPCLIVRLAPACSNAIPEESPRLPVVIASQIEHGIIKLVHLEDPLVTVLMDCEGLTPFRFPVQMMRSCAILLQDHYPNRLAALFVVRLPPVARVVAQALFQVLRPGTRRKLQIIGRDYQEELSNRLQTLPSLLGGACLCPKCSKLAGAKNSLPGPSKQPESEEIPISLSEYSTQDFEFVKCKTLFKVVVIGLVLLLICIVFALQIRDLQGLGLYSKGVW